jgi:nucleotide-binding universal stress UspA family protein
MRVQINRILCATDFSDFSNQTLAFGTALAREFNASLLICHIVELPFAATYGEVQIDPIQQQERMTAYAQEELSRLIDAPDIDWTPIVAIGHPGDEIARLVAQENIDFVISATHGRSGLKRLLLGSVTERLMRTVACPLLIVRDQIPSFVVKPFRAFHPKKILVGCDFSTDSELAFGYGLSLAQEFQAQLHLAHIIEPLVYQDIITSVDLSEESYRAGITPQLRRKLTQMVPEEARHWCDPVTVMLEGKPDIEICRYAEFNDIDLIILGVRGHGLVESLLVGSTTDRVARQAPCPVLTVRPISKA